MSAAAYNRGSRVVARQIADGDRPKEFEMMDELNGLPKYPDAGLPFGPIHFVFSHGLWWAACPTTGFGYTYPTLREAVRRWRVQITAYAEGVFIGHPEEGPQP